MQSGLSPVATHNVFGLSKLPSYKAHWIPVFWEPIPLSGERLTALIAVLGEDGNASVRVVIRDDVIKVLYPTQSENVADFLRWVADDLLRHLTGKTSLEGWQLPATGFHLGPISPSLSDGVEDVFEQAIPTCSSLSAPDLYHEMQPEKSYFLSQDRWRQAIRTLVVQGLPRLENCFNKPFVVSDGARATKIDFIGARLAANFGSVSPSQLSRSVRDAKSQILDLAILRDQEALLPPAEAFKMMLWLPQLENDFVLTDMQAKNISEAFLEMQGEGRRLGLAVNSYGNASEAAKDIFEAEMAVP